MLVATALLIIGVLFAAQPTLAATISLDPFGGGAQFGDLSSDTGLGEVDPVIVAAQIINVLLRLLGFFTVILMLYGGWLWIWARGNEETINQAKDIIKGTFIGLILILSSLGIMQYTFYYLTKITDAVA